MESLAALYHITPENLALRRAFIGLDDELVALLAGLRPWGDEVADEIAAEVTDHHFRSTATVDFFRTHAAERGVEFAGLRAEWQAARAAHWRGIFAEPARPEPFGIEYFAKLLEAGAGYNRMNLPMKWYLGRYPAYLDAVRRQLRENPPRAAGTEGRRRGLLRRGGDGVGPAVLAEVERAIGIVFNYDLQAITDAFYFDTFATMGVDLAAVRERGVVTDLSDRTSELKSTVHESLRLFIDSSQSMHDVFAQVRGNVDQTDMLTISRSSPNALIAVALPSSVCSRQTNPGAASAASLTGSSAATNSPTRSRPPPPGRRSLATRASTPPSRPTA